MLDNINAAYVQLLTLLSFSVSVVAAVLAIDMYRLLRTAEVGNSWRILIIASVVFALTLALRLAENFDWGGLNRYQLSRFGETMFVLALAYAFYLQRRAFTPHRELRREARREARPETEKLPAADVAPARSEMDDVDELAQYYAEGGASRGLPGR